MRSLANRSLVVPDQEEEAFVLVPMVADFLRKARPEVVKETGHRLEKRAYALIVENGGKKHDRLSALDAAWPAVAAALPRFLAGENRQLQTVCNALSEFLHFSGRWDERLNLALAALDKAKMANDFSNAGWRAWDVCWVHYKRGNCDEVKRWSDRATLHWGSRGTANREKGYACETRLLWKILRKDYKAARKEALRSVDLWSKRSRSSPDVARGVNDAGFASRLLGDCIAAERYYSKALDIAKVVKDSELCAGIPNNLAALALDREEWAKAAKWARFALPRCEKLGRRDLIASCHHRLAQALARQGKKEEALPHARRAVDICAKLGSPDLKEAQETLAECEG